MEIDAAWKWIIVCDANYLREQTMREESAEQGKSSEVQDVISEVVALRGRVRRRRRLHTLGAVLVGAVSAGGAAAFLVAPQITTRVCEIVNGGLQCVEVSSSFGLWWYWPVAGVAGLVAPFMWRYRQGTWRPPRWWWLAALFLVVIGPATASVVDSRFGPEIYPLVAAGILGGVAWTRRSPWGVGAAITLVVAQGWVLLRWDPTFLLTRNLGLAASSAAVSGVALTLAAAWWAQDRR
jgi:hypothetical protein